MIEGTHSAPVDEGERCCAPAKGGPCILAAGHNRGQADIPSNHQAEQPMEDACETFLDAVTSKGRRTRLDEAVADARAERDKLLARLAKRSRQPGGFDQDAIRECEHEWEERIAAKLSPPEEGPDG